MDVSETPAGRMAARARAERAAAVTDHADTIRRIRAQLHASLAAEFDAILAELRQAQEAWVDCAEKLKAAVAERRRAIDAYEAQREETGKLLAERAIVRAERRQAIDALREAEQLDPQEWHEGQGWQAVEHIQSKICAALVKLGEQP